MLHVLEHFRNPIVIIWLLLVLTLEYRAFKVNATAAINNDGRLIKNFFFGLLFKFVIPVFLIFIVHILSKYYLYKLDNSFFIFLIDFLALDLSLYWFHVISHKNPSIWRFHAVHHLDEQLDATTGIRVHFGELILRFIFQLPAIYFLAIPVETYILFGFVHIMLSIFHHSNIHITNKIDTIINQLIIMPSMHSVHHHAIPNDTNSNYGFVFSFWDKIFRTYNPSKREDNWKFGLKYATEKSLAKLIFYPFTTKHLRNY